MVLRLTLILLLIMTINVATAKEVQCLADMAYIEARGEGSRGIKAVTDVMFNRIKSPKFPSAVCSNYYKRGQYERAGAINKTPGVRQTEAYLTRDLGIRLEIPSETFLNIRVTDSPRSKILSVS